MLRSKALLFSGIILLVLGIFLKKMTSLEVFGLILTITGVFLKTIYIVSKARSGEYRAGKELYFLGVGLVFFLSGIYLRAQGTELINPLYLIAIGIGLKLIFVIRFIQIVRNIKEKNNFEIGGEGDLVR